MSLIFRAVLYSELIPNNLGIIFRKEYTDLRDSTVRDFEKYTGMKVDSNRAVTFSNGSVIMFRHLEEINNIQNINLGHFSLEQCDELASSNEFFMLFGRLRRDLKPSDEFVGLGLPLHTGFVIGNAGDHWGKELWLDGSLDDSECIQASTFDNTDILPAGFLESLEILKKQKPEMYRQYVLNEWDVDVDNYTVVKSSALNALKGLEIHEPSIKRIVSIDPSMGGDECPVFAFEGTKMIDTLYLNHKDTMKIVGEVMLFMAKHGIEDVAVDCIGIGAGVADRLAELGKRVLRINSAESSSNNNKFANRRAEMWWYVSQLINDRKVHFPDDDKLRKQLSGVRYKVINSNGKIQIEYKPDFKKRFGESPDRADAFIYGIWGLQQVEPLKKKDKYFKRADDYEFNAMTC